MAAACTGQPDPAPAPTQVAPVESMTPTATAPIPSPSTSTPLPPAPVPTATPAALADTNTPAAQDTPAPTATEPPAVTPTQPVAPPAQANCKDLAVFVDDVTIPDGTMLRQGETFVKTWRVKNAGDCTWGEGYSIVFAGGEVMNAPISSPLPQAAPGASIDISLSMTAPMRGGSYISNWEFQNPAGARFGVGVSGAGPLWTEISISFFNPTAQPSGGGGTPVPVSGQCPATRNTSFEASILASINQARQQNGLAPLQLQSQLSAAALSHSTDMACNNNVSHTGTDGSTWYDRVNAQGYANYTSSRENIYVGNPDFGGDAAGAFAWWMNSQVHRDNILFAHVSEIGIAYVFNPDSEFGGYYTTVFARP